VEGLHVRSQGKTDTHIRGDDAKCQLLSWLLCVESEQCRALNA